MCAFEVFREAIQIGGVHLQLADIPGNVLIKILANLDQFILQVTNLGPGGVVAIDAGAVIIAQRRPEVIAAWAV